MISLGDPCVPGGGRCVPLGVRSPKENPEILPRCSQFQLFLCDVDIGWQRPRGMMEEGERRRVVYVEKRRVFGE